MKDVILSLVLGLVIGFIIGYLKFPALAPQTLAGVVGILGLFIGYGLAT